MYLELLSIHFYVSEHEVDPNSVAVALYVDTVFKSLNSTSFANTSISYQHNLEGRREREGEKRKRGRGRGEGERGREGGERENYQS